MYEEIAGRDGFTLVIANPRSGRGRGGRTADDLSKSLEKRGVRAAVFVTGRRGDAVRRSASFAAQANKDGFRGRVVVIGGDGTVNEVVNGISGTGIGLTVLAAGTGNIVAREFGLPRTVDSAADAAAWGREIRVDVGVFGKRAFVCVASAGFDAEVARLYGKERSAATGYFEYVHPFTKSLLDYRLPRLSVEIDGVLAGAPVSWLLASNTRMYGASAVFCDDADPADGFLDVVSMGVKSTLESVPYFLLSLAGQFSMAPGVRRVRAKQVNFRPVEGPVPVQLDGDFAGFCTDSRPGVIFVREKALTIVAPSPEGGRS